MKVLNRECLGSSIARHAPQATIAPMVIVPFRAMLDQASRRGIRRATFDVELRDYTEEDGGLRWKVTLIHTDGEMSALGRSGIEAFAKALDELSKRV